MQLRSTWIANLPSSTAKLNPAGQSFCLGPPTNSVLIPILLNNTKPSHIRYTISHPNSQKVDTVDIGTKELRQIEEHLQKQLQLTKSAANDISDINEEDWDAEDEDEEIAKTSGQRLLGYPSASNKLEKTQSYVHLKVTKPGVVRLVRVQDSATSDTARIYPNEISVVPCPRMSFVPDKISSGDSVRCMGSKEELGVKVYGVPPLTLKWHREINGRREHFSVDRIEGSPDVRLRNSLPYCIYSSFIAETGTSRRASCSFGHAS